jgi:hypothetical protein
MQMYRPFPDTHGFNFPITITTVHMGMKWLLCVAWYCTSSIPIPSVGWQTHLYSLFPIGAMTAGDIVFSNLSITHLSLSIYTTVKSATLIFIFLGGVLLGVEQYNTQILLSVLGIVGGIALAVDGAANDGSHSSGTTAAPVTTYGLFLITMSSICAGIALVCHHHHLHYGTCPFLHQYVTHHDM